MNNKDCNCVCLHNIIATEMKEQIAMMRAILVDLVEKHWEVIDDAFCPGCGEWYGNRPEDLHEDYDYNIHKSNCWIRSAKLLLETI